LDVLFRRTNEAVLYVFAMGGLDADSAVGAASTSLLLLGASFILSHGGVEAFVEQDKSEE
jgi:hypothetical protein